MESRDTEALARFQEKLGRELRSGLVTLVLLLVVERTGPTYGYRILSTIKEASHGHLAFKEGTAYPLLNNLEKMGLIESYWGTGTGGPPRKYYQATALGRAALDEALEEWFGLIGSVERLIRDLGKRKGTASDDHADTTPGPAPDRFTPRPPTSSEATE